MSLKEKRKYLPLLKIIVKLRPEARAHLVPYLKPDAVEFLCECFHNVLYTDIGIKNKAKLRKCLKANCSVSRLKTISTKSRPIEAKIRSLKQEGKGLGLILSAAIPFLMNLFSRK